jgi:RecA-family ATPase
VPIRAAELRDLADEKNEQGEYLFPDLGPAASIEQLLFRPERPYLVEGVLTQGSLALLSAESFVGKTFFGMELARAVSTGTPFMGKYPVSRGGVLYIAQDGSDEEYIRQWRKVAKSHWDDYAAYPDWQVWRAVLTGERVPAGDLSEPPAHPFNNRIRLEFNNALGIDISDDVTRIGLTALRMEHSRGEVWRVDEAGARSVDPDATEKGVRLIVFDAGHSVFFGNENDSGEVQNVMTNLRQLANATGATVMLMTHLNKYSSMQSKQGIPKVHENRVRGSGVFQSAPDWHMQLHRGKADGEIYAFQLKDRAGNRCKSFIFSMTFDEQRQQMTLAHHRDMSAEEHRDRKVRPIALMPDLPDPKVAVVAEFDKGHEMSRYDVAAALRLLPQFKDKADSTVEDAAKEMISRLEDDGVIRQTQKPAKGRKALYRKADVGQESA